MEICNACRKPKRDPRYKACETCREGWRLDKGRKTIPIEEHEMALNAANRMADAITALLMQASPQQDKTIVPNTALRSIGEAVREYNMRNSKPAV